jgi:hypothetical protein
MSKKLSYVCPNFLPFLEPKSEHFLFHLLHRNFAQFFCLFWSQNRSTFYITCYIGILPNFFALFGAKIGAFSFTYYRGILPKNFAFVGAKIGALSIYYYYPLFCPNLFPLKLIFFCPYNTFLI